MKVVIAPDSYKGSLTALEVATAIETGFRRVFPGAEIVKVPMADGGEGTVQSLVDATGGQIIRVPVTGPLGERVEAFYGILGDGKTAIIEMAAASGLPLVPKEKRDPRITTTFGTGELIRSALDRGCRRLLIGIGGSATNDGGAGMAQALGARLEDEAGREIPPGGAALCRLARIDIAGMDRRLAEAEIVAACDVDNPLYGPRGAAAVYGPQKGATPAMVEELDGCLRHYAEVARKDLGVDIADLPGAGAAGGLGGGLVAFLHARLRPGVEIVIEATDLAGKVRDADLVITGEGGIDRQTIYGKAPIGVARTAKRFGVPVVVIAGSVTDDADVVYEHGVDALESLVKRPMTLEEAVANAAALASSAAERVARLLRLGGRMRLG
ncbi:MAG: glycerate kinase [Syntrophothermus sp.]